MRGIHAGHYQRRHTQRWQQQALEQGDRVFTGIVRSGSTEGMPVMENYLSEAAFNYARNMTYVIFCGKWFLRPVVRWFVQWK
jgi:hypothetical protein